MTRVSAITSRDNPLLLRLRKLVRQPDGYRRHGRLWIEGEKLCRAYLQRGSAAGTQALITEAAWSDPDLRLLASRADGVAVVPESLMAGISGLEAPSSIGLEIAWAGSAGLRAAVPTLVLDRLQDAGNVGTILRSAAAFGFRQVVALKGTAALWSPKTLRAGMGAHFGLDLLDGADESVLDGLTVPMLATSSHARELVHEAQLPQPCAWVFGHEGQGVGASVLARCAAVLAIPQPGGEESLNVAAAAAVCMYESVRRAPRG